MLLKSKKNLKRCGKRIQLHCDYDEDGSITETEWNMCIGVKKGKVVGKILTHKYAEKNIFRLRIKIIISYFLSEEHISKIIDPGEKKRKESIPFFHWLKDYD